MDPRVGRALHASERQGRRSTGFWILGISVLAADAVCLLAVLFIRVAFPWYSGQDGEGQFWIGLLLAYRWSLFFGLAVVLNVLYLIVLGLMRGRCENGYGPIFRSVLFLLPAAAIQGLTVR